MAAILTPSLALARQQRLDSLLETAISMRSSKVCELLEQGAKPNAIYFGKNRPLHIACSRGNQTAVRALLSARQIDLLTVNRDGLTPLAVACLKKHFSIASDLIEAWKKQGDDLDWFLSTPLFQMSSHGSLEAVQFLLDQGANPNVLGPEGTSALHEARKRRHIKMMETLLEHRARSEIHIPAVSETRHPSAPPAKRPLIVTPLKKVDRQKIMKSYPRHRLTDLFRKNVLRRRAEKKRLEKEDQGDCSPLV